jgi:hypothetical protein
MTLQEIQAHLQLEPVTEIKNADRKIEGGYASDLLSWVMAHAKENQLWITIQSHQNIVAVASLLGLAGIIVAEGVQVDESTIKKANTEGINIFTCKKSIYDICGILYNLLSGDNKKC